MITELIPKGTEDAIAKMVEALRLVPEHQRTAALGALCVILIKTGGTLRVEDLRP